MLDEQIFRLMEDMPDPLVLITEDGTITFADNQAATLLGYAPDEFVGRTPEWIVPARYRARFADCLIAGLDPSRVPSTRCSLNVSLLDKNGREVPVDINFCPIETASGWLIAACLRDLSDRQQLELELRSALAEVECLRDRLLVENVYLQEEAQTAGGFDEMVGKSDELKLLLHKIDQVAATDAPVLILGETGTGKELVAGAIHEHSQRQHRPLVKINCAALPSALIESELFGHEAGAFTGALKQKIGRFEVANGGTIFLDEIGEMPLELQSKLLRVIQEGVFWRLGSTTTTQVDVRVLAATNRDLQLAMQQDKFRSDLYYRLAVFPIEVPPLRVRCEDIPLLVWHFISLKQVKYAKRFDEISQRTMDRLTDYAWPGNIRELENVLERAMILSPGSTLIVEPLLDAVESPARRAGATSGSVNSVLRDHIVSVLQDCHWRIKGPGAAADRLDINPSTLRYRMKQLGIERPRRSGVQPIGGPT